MSAPDFYVFPIGISVVDKCMHLNQKIPLLVVEDLHCQLRPCLLTDPVPLEEMFYHRSKNPEKPGWIAVRGSSSIEGGHSYYHASLPSTNYSAYLAGTIVACRLCDARIKVSARNMGSTAFSLDDAYAEHCKKQLCKPEWHYSLPNSVQVPDHTDLEQTTCQERLRLSRPKQTCSGATSMLLSWQQRRSGSSKCWLPALVWLPDQLAPMMTSVNLNKRHSAYLSLTAYTLPILCGPCVALLSLLLHLPC